MRRTICVVRGGNYSLAKVLSGHEVSEDSLEHYRHCEILSWLAWNLGFISHSHKDWFNAYREGNFGRPNKSKLVWHLHALRERIVFELMIFNMHNSIRHSGRDPKTYSEIF